MDLKQIQDDLVELIRIEGLIKLSRITESDVLSLHRLADKFPRAEYICGVYAFFCLKGVELAHQWFQKCKKHANGYFLWKLAMVYHKMGSEWVDESMACMTRSAWRRYPRAMKVMRELLAFN